MEIILILIFSVVCAVVSAKMAGSRNRGPAFWGLMGFVGAPMPILVLMILGRKYASHREELEAVAKKRQGY